MLIIKNKDFKYCLFIERVKRHTFLPTWMRIICGTPQRFVLFANNLMIVAMSSQEGVHGEKAVVCSGCDWDDESVQKQQVWCIGFIQLDFIGFTSGGEEEGEADTQFD